MNKKFLFCFCVFLASCTSMQISPSPSSTFTPSPPTLTFTPVLPAKINTSTFTPTFTLATTTLFDEITDIKGIKMRFVPSGVFTMGEGDMAHKVNFDSYYMDIYEVTNAAYKLCVDAGACNLPRYTDKYNDSTYSQHPVVFVDWDMATNFCKWRDARLPTEAEWEKAARDTDQRTYPWGEGISCSTANYYSCVGDNTTVVGSYESGKSPYGMYDMAGNVWEWVSSLYQHYPYDATDGRENMNSACYVAADFTTSVATLAPRIGIKLPLTIYPLRRWFSLRPFTVKLFSTDFERMNCA